MKELAPRCGRPLLSGNACGRKSEHAGNCQAKRKQNQRVWASARRSWWYGFLAEYKTARGCAICGFQNQRGGYFDLDHTDRDTPWAGKGVIYYARRLDPYNAEHVQRVLDELTKCQVLCTACHREKTSLDLAGDWAGTAGIKKT